MRARRGTGGLKPAQTCRAQNARIAVAMGTPRREQPMAPPDPRAPTSAETSWFCCGASWGPCGSAGGGACGNCSSGSHQCAWPNTSANCFNVTRPDPCGGSPPRRTCGHVFYVTNQCNGSCVSVSIADCGPDTNSFCGERTCCGST